MQTIQDKLPLVVLPTDPTCPFDFNAECGIGFRLLPKLKTHLEFEIVFFFPPGSGEHVLFQKISMHVTETWRNCHSILYSLERINESFHRGQLEEMISQSLQVTLKEEDDNVRAIYETLIPLQRGGYRPYNGETCVPLSDVRGLFVE